MHEPNHESSCGSLATSEIGEALRASGQLAAIASRPVAGGDGPVRRSAHPDRHGRGPDWPRAPPARRPFETGAARPELTKPARQPRYGDYDGGEGEAFTASTRAAAAQIAQQMGIERTSPRERGMQRLASYALSNRQPVRPVHPDYSGAGSRRDALRQPVRAGQLTRVNDYGDGLAGAQPQYSAGMLT